MTLKSVEKKDNNIVELQIEVGKEGFEEAVSRAYKKNAGKLNVPGFRKGKAPRKIIESIYGQGVFYDDAVNELCPKAYDEAVKESKIEPVERPSIDIVDISEEGLKFSATVTVKPEAKLGKYKGLEAERLDITVRDKDIDAEIELIRSRNARLETVTRPLKEGDTAVIDFEGFLDGVAFEGGKGEKYSLSIGSGQFIPGFEEQLVGMNAEESRDINVTFPEDYGQAELAGKPVIFKVFLHEVKENILPELDDEFAKDVSEFDTLEEYRKSVAEDIESKRATKADELFEANLVGALVENLEADIPEAMISSQIRRMTEEFSYRLAMQGINLNQYMKMMNIGPADMDENFREQAVRQVKTSLALEEICKSEKFEVTDEEIADEYEKLAAQYNMSVDEVKGVLDETALRYDLTNMKAMYYIRDNAIIKKSTGDSDDTEKAKSKKTGTTEADKPKARTAAKPKAKAADSEAAPEAAPAKPKKKTAKKSDAE